MFDVDDDKGYLYYVHPSIRSRRLVSHTFGCSCGAGTGRCLGGGGAAVAQGLWRTFIHNGLSGTDRSTGAVESYIYNPFKRPCKE